MTVADDLALRLQAGRIAARAELLDVRMMDSTAHLIRTGSVEPPLTWSLDIQAGVEYDGERNFVVRARYELLIVEQGDENDPFSDEARHVAQIAFTLGGLFELTMLEDDAPPADGELEAYAGTTGQFALYPYAREYVHDVTSRIGLPPLTLSVLKIPAAQ